MAFRGASALTTNCVFLTNERTSCYQTEPFYSVIAISSMRNRPQQLPTSHTESYGGQKIIRHQAHCLTSFLSNKGRLFEKIALLQFIYYYLEKYSITS